MTDKHSKSAYLTMHTCQIGMLILGLGLSSIYKFVGYVVYFLHIIIINTSKFKSIVIECNLQVLDIFLGYHHRRVV